MRKTKKAFTLIELMIVIAIIGILAALAVPNFSVAIKKGRDARRKSDINEVQQALLLYRADNGTYPQCTGGSPCWPGSSVGWRGPVVGTVTPPDMSTYITTLPQPDGIIGTTDGYRYTPGTVSGGRIVTFHMCTEMEALVGGVHQGNSTGDAFGDVGNCPNAATDCPFFCVRSP